MTDRRAQMDVDITLHALLDMSVTQVEDVKKEANRILEALCDANLSTLTLEDDDENTLDVWGADIDTGATSYYEEEVEEE